MPVRRRRPTIAAVVAAVLVLLGGCSSGDGGTATPPTTAASGTGSTRAASAGLAAAFGTVTVRVTLPDGSVREWCLWLADTDPLRQRGLMFVTDPTLEGRPGMLFAFDEDHDGGFWMRNTRLPLSIVYLDADGRPVSTADMAPCPDEDATCPTYRARGAYRAAIEVPQGRLADLGIVDGATVEIGERGCPAPPATGPPATA